MRKFLLSMVFLLLCVVAPLNAQAMNYQYAYGTQAFTPVTTGSTFLTSGFTGTSDDGYSAPVAIGFPFSYAGATYDSFQVSTNGFLRLGSGLTSATGTNALAGTLRRIIAPLWDDLDLPDSSVSLTYLLSGSAPNRVLTVQWLGVKWPFSAAAANAEFQVKLYETTNKVEFNYGVMGTPANTVTASIGLSDNTTVTTTDLATGTFLSLQVGGDTGSRTLYATSGLEFKTVFLNPDNNTLISFNAPGSPMSGTYTVGGTTPDFATLSLAANALNTRGVSGAVTLNVRAGTYEDVFHLTRISGVSATNTVTVKNESGTVTLSPKNGGRTSTTVSSADAVIRLDGARFVTIDGINITDNTLNNTATLKFEMGIVLANSIANGLVTSSAKFNIIKNLAIDLNATNATSTLTNNNAIGIRFGTLGLAPDTSLTNSYNTIQDVVIEDYWRAAVFAYGFSGTLPDYGNKITAVTGRNLFGNVNITSGTAIDVRSVELNAQFDFTVEKTDIKNISVTNIFTTNSVYGIRGNPASSTDHLGGRLIFRDLKIENLELQSTTATSGMVVGIEVNRVAANTEITITNNSVSDLFSNGTTGRAEGILLAVAPQSGNTATAHVYNNLIYDIRAIRSTTAPSVRGMDFQSSAGNLVANVTYNSIYIDNSVANTAATHQSAGIYWANYGTSTLVLRNNIVVNTMVSGTRATALYASANSNLLRLSPSSNNNLYYSGVPSATAVIAYDGVTSYDSLFKYKNAVATGGLGGPREVLSVTEMPPFVSAVSPYNLNMQTTTPTRGESGGVPVAGITTDYAGNTRNANFPDIGAYEYGGIAIDNNPPSIVYTNLGNTHFTSNRPFVVTIADPSGVATGTNLPRLYYRKSVNDAYVFDAAPTVSGNDYTFTFNYSALPGGSVSLGDTISYYVAAQDVNGVSVTNPSGGSGSNPPGTTAPLTFRTFNIIGTPLNGVYTITAATFNKLLGKNITPRVFERTVSGSAPVALLEEGLTDKDGNPVTVEQPETRTEQYEVLYEGDAPYRGSRSLNQTVIENAKAAGLIESNIESVYPSIAAAVTDLNLRGVSGNVTFLLADTLYSTTSQTISIAYDSLPNANRQITFKPAAGVTSRISATSTSPVFIVGNDYVTIDGANTVGGTSRDLTIENSGAGATAGVAFWQAHYGTVKNIVGQTLNSTTGYGIVFSASTYGKIVNNLVRRTTLGIQLQGSSNFTEILNNTVGAPDSANKIQNDGIIVLNSTNYSISKNVVSGILRATTGATRGIIVGIATGNANPPSPGIISENTLKDIKMTGTSTNGYSSVGITLSSNINNSDIIVANNLIYDIYAGGDGSSPSGTTYTPHGIRIVQGGGYKIYFNSVNLFGALASTSTSALRTGALTIENAVTVASLDIRNNVLSNSMKIPLGAGTKASHAIYSGNANTTFTDINNNDYYVSGTEGVLGYLTNNITTLADWQTATGKDANSIAGNPQFTDTLNVRPVLGSPVYFAGTPVSVTTDFLGTTRSATTPSIGAYEFPLVNIGWANLQWPGSASVIIGKNTTVYGQIWIDGVTNQPGAGTGIKAWVGYSTTDTDPSTWTNWIAATYNTEVGNNDEYQANIGSTLVAGTYYYAYKYQVYGNPAYYGGYSTNGGGQWNGTTNLSGVLSVQNPFTINWEASAATTTLPAWMGTGNSERGLAWGRVNMPTEGLVGKVVVPGRKWSNAVYLLNDSTGVLTDSLNVTGITGGTLAINDAEIDHLGRIYVCNLTTSSATSPFIVYRWDNTGSAPKAVLSYTGDAVRLGDKFTVAYDSVARGAVIWAASATTGSPKVYKFYPIGLDSVNQVPTVVTLSDNITTAIGSASVGPLYNGDFYWKSGSQSVRKYKADGTIIDTIPGTVVATGANAIRFVGKVNGSEFFAVYQFGAGNNNVRVVEVPNGDPNIAVTYGISPSLGANANANGTGDVAVKQNFDGSHTVFVLATNNGLGSYKAIQVIPVEFSAFSASVENRDVTLAWKTATETNSSAFSVERTVSGKNSWSSVGSVAAAGTSTEMKSYSYLDRGLTSAKYQYRLKQIDLDGTYSYSKVVEVEVGVPTTFGMSQNYPNPFNPVTRIEYQVPANSRVTVELYDISGQKVASLVNTELAAGYYSVDLSANSFGLASGVYFYRMTAIDLNGGQNFVNTKKMVMLK